MNIPVDEISDITEKRRDEIIGFLQEMVRTPSLSTHEGEIAEIISKRMRDLGYDRVYTDSVGNIVGEIRGSGGRTLLFNGHSDHVPPGNMKDPYSGVIVDGRGFDDYGDVVYGRGTADMKGALAAMIMGAEIAKEVVGKPSGDVYVTISVLEEPGGQVGTRALVDKDGLRPNVAVIGECTDMKISLGHRGVMWLEVAVKGVSCHASAPDRGVNAILKAGKIVDEIQRRSESLPIHEVLGKTSMAITRISAKPDVGNIIPYECTFNIDIRNVTGFDEAKATGMVRGIIEELGKDDPQLEADVRVVEEEWKTYTGYTERAKTIHTPFYTQPTNEFAVKAKEVLSKILQKRIDFAVWRFATDGCTFADMGIPTIGFGPGEEKFTHSIKEHIRVEDVIAATKVYAALSLALH